MYDLQFSFLVIKINAFLEHADHLTCLWVLLGAVIIAKPFAVDILSLGFEKHFAAVFQLTSLAVGDAVFFVAELRAVALLVVL